MLIIKCMSLITILILSSYVGIIVSKKYKNRVIELKEIKRALNIFETKIKYTYEPIPDIFTEISENLNPTIGKIFKSASEKMSITTAKEAWQEAVSKSQNSMTKEDIDVIKGLGKLLGETDIDGQVSQIELTDKFIDSQIEKAQHEYEKNNKLYKTLRSSFRTSIGNCSNIKEKRRKLWILIYFLK